MQGFQFVVYYIFAYLHVFQYVIAKRNIGVEIVIRKNMW